MKNIYLILISLFTISCNTNLMDNEASQNPEANFNALWNVINKRYSYLELKNVDWNQVYDEYLPIAQGNINKLEEFEIYDEMLYKLKDGHVNLNSGFDVTRNWDWYLDYPSNFNYDVVERNYLGEDYMITGGLKHRLLDSNIAYVYYGSFSNSVAGIDLITLLYKNADGIIIDIRNNGGGKLDNATDLVNRFANQEIDVLKIRYKNGPNPDDFSAPDIRTTNPTGSYTYNKKIVLLTNRKCYSASSYFTAMMKQLPNVTVIGDTTGGGAGIPADYMLPNGWLLRYSCTQTTDGNDVDFELGVSPDIELNLDENLLQDDIDSMIEYAEDYISN